MAHVAASAVSMADRSGEVVSHITVSGIGMGNLNCKQDAIGPERLHSPAPM